MKSLLSILFLLGLSLPCFAQYTFNFDPGTKIPSSPLSASQEKQHNSLLRIQIQRKFGDQVYTTTAAGVTEENAEAAADFLEALNKTQKNYVFTHYEYAAFNYLISEVDRFHQLKALRQFGQIDKAQENDYLTIRKAIANVGRGLKVMTSVGYQPSSQFRKHMALFQTMVQEIMDEENI